MGVAGGLLLVVVGAPAQAAAVTPVPPSTVSADVLPTVQVTGVVWDQVVVGDRVYATGSFTSARPAGAAAGTQETKRANLLAYDIRTGELVSSWAPTLDAQGLVITASADGRTVYVGGDFTAANGAARKRVAAFDAATGALVTAFAADTNGRVRGLAVADGTLYVGGDFSVLRGQPRTRLAAVSASTGALTTWAPVADREVMALVVPAGSGSVVVSGRFETLGGQAARGSGALDRVTGRPLPWAVNQTVQNYGPSSAIWSLSTDGQQVYGTGYDYRGPSKFENSFAASVDGGALVWVNGCLGDTYSSQPVGGVLYTVGHAHNCSPLGGHPQTSPETYQRALATTTVATGTNRSGAFAGKPAPGLLHWLPTVAQGTATGQAQGAWDVTGDGRYVVLGGEFPRVNGVAQQGLARFAVRPAAPGTEGPQVWDELTPAATAVAPGLTYVTWKSSWDRDDADLTYELLRGSTATSSVVLDRRTAPSTWWSRPTLAFTDRTAPRGATATYRVRVTDASGNTMTSRAAAVVTADGDVPSAAYVDAVTADGARSFWRLGETSGPAAVDWVGNDDLALGTSATRGVDGALDGDAATRFAGTQAVPATTRQAGSAPQTFTVEAWVRTRSTSGGKVVGFGSSSDGTSSVADRHLYLDGAGRVSFGVISGTNRVLSSGTGYNDGRWHQVVGTLGPQGQSLYVDGRRVATSPTVTSARDYTGFWRVGGDRVNGWSRAGVNSLAGDVDDVSVYGAALTPRQVAAHYSASGRTPAGGRRPSDAYGQAVHDGDPDLFWRLDETSGTTTSDAGSANRDGVVLGGARWTTAGRLDGAVALDGSDDEVATRERVAAPATWSAEVWFATSSTRGGGLVSLGDAASGRSARVERSVQVLDDGRLRLVVPGGVVETTSGYADGSWHQVVATQDGAGTALYVDGVLAGSSDVAGRPAAPGFWRLGGDAALTGTTSHHLAGRVDEASIFSRALSAAQVRSHFLAGGGDLPNETPTAAATVTTDGLTVEVDASASADADGTVTSYAWDFGDGARGTGVTTSHAYLAAGTYDVTLVVSDDRGATASTRTTVTVTAPAPGQVPATTSPALALLARDAFERDVSEGLGAAEVGGSWTTTAGPTSSFSVAGGSARLQAERAGVNRTAVLPDTRSAATDVATTLAVDTAPTGGGLFATVVGRRVSATDDYRAKVRYQADGRVVVYLAKVVDGVETTLSTSVVPGVQAAPGQPLRVRLQVTGTGTTQLAVKVWPAASAEPEAWLASAVDATPSLQAAGGLGVSLYVSGSGQPATLLVDDLVATTVG
ncbi:LamG-like jellyroll fold domain-containing protein [Pseudokineococcus sp. 1T1Z-3]|uniref:LamG-like jellyroll fold domain-containing protein n=1 Tax=Pseudokineococcus sp. 1T1Z-3 TaxID=3132745 RepID=UPI00309C1EFD